MYRVGLIRLFFYSPVGQDVKQTISSLTFMFVSLNKKMVVISEEALINYFTSQLRINLPKQNYSKTPHTYEITEAAPRPPTKATCNRLKANQTAVIGTNLQFFQCVQSFLLIGIHNNINNTRLVLLCKSNSTFL